MKRRTKKRSQRCVTMLEAARKQRQKPSSEADQRRDQRDVERLDHLVDVFGNVERLRQIHPAFGIIVFQAAVVIGRGQVEHRAPDLPAVARQQLADEVEEMRQPVPEFAGVALIGEPQRAGHARAIMKASPPTV